MLNLILSIALVLTTAIRIDSAPIYLIFEGAVDQSSSGNYIKAPEVGPTKLILKADFDKVAFRSLWLGHPTRERIDYYGDYASNGYTQDLFYTEFVIGPTYEGGLGNPWGEESFMGEITYVPGRGYSHSFHVTQPDQRKTFSNLSLYTQSYSASPLEIGSYYYAWGYSDDDKSWGASMKGHFYLTAITETLPPEAIPEPETMALFILGFVVIGLKFRSKICT